MEPKIYVTARLRKSPFFERTIAAGATTLSVYNKTYLPGGYATMEEEFRHLIEGVTMWDVTCQRIVEIAGPDARRFLDRLTPRSLATVKPGLCRYLLITDRAGGILNDPVMLCLAEDRFWLSCADGDVLMWAKGVAATGEMDVTLSAPETATLQLQGPKSLTVLQSLVGQDIEELKYYCHRPATIAGIPVIVARTGWSAERGYEIYLEDMASGPALWDAVMAAGAPQGIFVTSPNRIRRIEAGILDYSVDLDETTNPFEVGLDRLVDLGPEANYIGKQALAAIAAKGVARRLVGLEIAGDRVAPNDVVYPVTVGGAAVGRMTSWVYSPRLDRSIGLAMLGLDHTAIGTEVVVEAPGESRSARVVEQPFIDPKRALSRT